MKATVVGVDGYRTDKVTLSVEGLDYDRKINTGLEVKSCILTPQESVTAVLNTRIHTFVIALVSEKCRTLCPYANPGRENKRCRILFRGEVPK